MVCVLKNYTLLPLGMGKGVNDISFDLNCGDVCAIKSERIDDARLLLKGLATLVYPQKGEYYFMEQKIDFSDYRKLLPFKRRIGYMALDSAMISNRTLKQNLLFKRYYFENFLYLDLDEKTKKLCHEFEIFDKLDTHAAKLEFAELRIAIAIREMSKAPKLLLLECPEDFIGHAKFGLFKEIFSYTLKAAVPVVFYSNNLDFTEKFSNMEIFISEGSVAVSRK